MTVDTDTKLLEIPGHCDDVIAALAKADATLLDVIVALTSDRDAYRLLALQAIHHCHSQHVKLVRLSARHERLANEFHTLRQLTLIHDVELG